MRRRQRLNQTQAAALRVPRVGAGSSAGLRRAGIGEDAGVGISGSSGACGAGRQQGQREGRGAAGAGEPGHRCLMSKSVFADTRHGDLSGSSSYSPAQGSPSQQHPPGNSRAGPRGATARQSHTGLREAGAAPRSPPLLRDLEPNTASASPTAPKLRRNVAAAGPGPAFLSQATAERGLFGDRRTTALTCIRDAPWH